MHEKMIFDFDLTMGLPDCDVDDGLSLLFALGLEALNPGSVEILGLCTSYGNNEQEAVYANTQRIVKKLKLDIPIHKGSSHKDQLESEAAHFLVEQAYAHPHEISLSVTGSTTNLKGALALDPDILMRFKQIVLMGGITSSLVFNGKFMDELNFSCDPEATYQILDSANRGARIVLMTANHCLPAHFMPLEFKQKLLDPRQENNWLYDECSSWFTTMERQYQLDGFCCWDVLTSAYILEPWLFTDKSFELVLNPRLLNVGFLEPAFSDAPSVVVNTPTIRDPEEFCSRAYELWQQAHLFT